MESLLLQAEQTGDLFPWSLLLSCKGLQIVTACGFHEFTMLHITLFAWGLRLRIPGRFCLLLLDWVLVRVNNLVNHLLNLVLLTQPGEFSFCQQRTSVDQLGMDE